MPTIYQTKFDGGMTNVTRNQTVSGDAGNQFLLLSHFNALDDPTRLAPYRSTEADENKAFLVERFEYADDVLWGAGGGYTGNKTNIVKKDGDPITASWTEPANNNGAGNGGAFVDTMFKAHTTSSGAVHLYGTDASGNMWKFGDITGTPSFTYNFQTGISSGATGQAVVHPSNKYLYFPHDYKIAELNIDGSTFDSAALASLPRYMTATCLASYGELLAIGMKQSSSVEKSHVFFWDLENADAREQIDWGEGDLEVLGTIGGSLVGVSNRYIDNSYGLGEGYISVKAYDGTPVAQEIIRLNSDDTIANPLTNQIVFKNDRMYFPAKVSIDGTDRIGIYVLYKSGGKFRISLEHIEEDLGGTNNIDGIFSLGNYWFIAHSGDGSVNRTNNDGNYSFTSTAITQKFNCGTTFDKKKLIACGLTFEKITAGTVTLKAKKETDSSFSTVFAEDTVGATKKIATKFSDQTNLPTFEEIQFQIESTGGIVVTGFWFKYEREKNNTLTS